MRRCLVRPACVLSALALLSGCLMDGTIDAKGGGTMTLNYRLTSESQLESSKKRLESAHVTLVSAKVDKDKHATFEIKFNDVTKLPTTQFFQHTTFTLADGEAGTRVLTVKFNNRNPSKLPDEMIAYFGKEVRFSLTLPGEVVSSNATETKDRTVAWTYQLSEFTLMREVTLNVVFKASGKEGEKPAAQAPAAKPGDAGAASDKGTEAPPTKPAGN